MRVAVVGGGIFGCTIAVDLARAGVKVDLFEKRSDIIEGATARCQARLHSGYHYPRSDTTAASARDAAPEFMSRYPTAIRRERHHYVIAADSKVSADEYLAFCDRLGLPYEVVEPPQVHHAQVCVRVPEAFVDVSTLRRLVRRDLAQADVVLNFGEHVHGPVLGYDLTIYATYGQPWSRPLRYELCEVALVEVARYQGQSFVVLDGDHVSLDPYGRVHALYDVANSVHDVSDDPARIIYPQRRVSRYEVMLKTASQHLRGLELHGQGLAIYHRSMFAIRAVLPDVDATDERPTLIERDGNVVSVLSGKICTAVTTARRVTQMVLGVTA
jgi:catechol 2,3-dioxygenase-like lactoylglutathione lyase family enzyme